MNRCILTVNADQSTLVDELQTELEKQYDSVVLLAVGSQRNVESIQVHLPKAICLLEVRDNYKDHHNIMTSLPALLEIGNSVSKFKSVTLWTDPEISSNFTSTNTRHLSSSHDLICSTIGDAISISHPNSIVSRTIEGQARWKNTYGIEIPHNPEQLATDFNSADNEEPLIEKSTKQRFLIDASNSHTTLPLVEPFLTLQEQVADAEIWCYYNGELPLWMRPDFQIHHIPSNETPLYTKSIDGVILAGDTLNRKSTIDYMNLGIFPIVVSNEVAIQLNEIIDTSAISASFPSFGSESLIHELAESEERLALYNSYCKTDLNCGVLFQPNILDDHKTNTEEFTNLINSTNFIGARKLYLESLYGDSEGSELHKSISKTENLIGILTGQQATLIDLSGWAINTAEHSEAEIRMYREDSEIPVLVSRKNRADVTKALDLDESVLCGFHATIALNHAVDINMHHIAMAATDKNIEKIEAYESHLTSITELPEATNKCESAENQEQCKGVLEHFDSKDVVAIEVSGDFSLEQNLILSFRNKDGEIPLTGTNFYLSTKDNFICLDPDSIEMFDNTLTLTPQELASPATLYIDTGRFDVLNANDIKCEVFSTKATTLTSSLNKQKTSTIGYNSDYSKQTAMN